MSPMKSLAGMLLLTGLVVAALGALLFLADRLPWLGRLPGDIYIQRRNVRFYFPVTTCILASVILTLLLVLFRRLLK